MANLFSRLLRSGLRLLARACFGLRVAGLGGALPAGPLLIVANHQSLLDGLLIGLFMPVEPVFVVHSDVVRQRFFRLLLTQVEYLVVDSTNPMAMRQVVRLVESGRPVLIFPEGRITITGALMKVYEGPAFVAAKTGATLLPVRVSGSLYSYFSRQPAHFPHRLFPRITLTVLPPTALAMPVAETARLRRKKAAENLRRLLQDMLFATVSPRTLYRAFCDAVRLYGRGRGVVEDIRRVEYSYGDVLKMALLLGHLLEQRTGLRERVGLLLPNLTPTLALIFGLSARRRIPALLNYTSGTEALQSACIAAEIRLLVTSRAFVEQARLQGKLAALAAVDVVYLEDLRAGVSWRDKCWLFAALSRPSAFALPASPEEAAVVLFTSGSEGLPKGVVLPHRALLANVAQIRAVIDIGGDDKVLNALPLFHAFGLTAGALLPVLAGARLFLYPTPLHYRSIPEVAYDRVCTVLLGTSTFLGNYARFAHPYDFFRLRYVVAGAEKLSDAVREAWIEKFGLRIFEGYGTTETAPVLAVNTPMAFRSGSVGQWLPGIDYRLQPVPGIARGGQLHVSGPNLMAGYLKADLPGVLQPPSSGFGPGWYDTGDIVEVDGDGFVSIVDRVKRFAKVAGEMISLEQVERLASAVAPAMQHAATTQDDPGRGEAIVLFTTDAQLSRQTLAAAARERGFSELVVPRKICQLALLPHLGSGKVDYVALKKYAEAL